MQCYDLYQILKAELVHKEREITYKKVYFLALLAYSLFPSISYAQTLKNDETELTLHVDYPKTLSNIPMVGASIEFVNAIGGFRVYVDDKYIDDSVIDKPINYIIKKRSKKFVVKRHDIIWGDKVVSNILDISRYTYSKKLSIYCVINLWTNGLKCRLQ
jgi:hypothetical protein